MGAVTRAARNIGWIESFCRVPEGKFVSQPVRLRPWQKKIIRGIYGGDTRRAIISFGRKNAKTTISAFLLLLHLVGPEARANSQLYSAAQSRDQAALIFSLAAKIARMSPDLNAVVGIRDTAKQLYCEELGTLYRALSADATTAYGLSPVFVVHDELGQVKGPRSELYDALETAVGAQEQPLSIIISTQAPTDGDLLSILIDDAKSGADPRTKLYLYTAPRDIDPFSRKAIKLANPALGDFLNAKEVAEQAAAAKRMPARETAYRNLVLNQRVTQHSPFISPSIWKQSTGKTDDAVFECGPVFVGLDLSARNDLTALVYIARDDANAWHVRAEFYAPAIGILDRAQRDRVPYDVWRAQGYLTATPGASVQYDWVARRLIELSDQYPVQAIAYDRWRIDVLLAELARLDSELPLEKHGQGYADMAPALDATEGALLNGQVIHDGNPIMTWCAANAIVVTDPAYNRKLDKSKSTGRIDGIVAMVMAIHVASRSIMDSASVYEARGILTL